MKDGILEHAVLNNIESIIYISDLETYELLYINEAGKKAFKIDNNAYQEKKCYQVLQGKEEPCSFCTNNKILKGNKYRWTNYNEILDAYFAITDQLIEIKPGYKARMEEAIDITANELQKQKLGNKVIIDETLLKCIKTLNENKDLKSAIYRMLAMIANFYEGNRAYIFEIDSENDVINNTYEWCAKGVSKEIDHLQNIPIQIFDSWIHQFEKQGSIAISSLDKDTDITSEEYQILANQGIESLIAAPLYNGNQLIGIIGVDDPKKFIENLELLTSISLFIMNDIQKRELIQQLQYLSYIDTLTGLYNRNRYTQELLTLKERKVNKLGVVYVDLNGLKLVNDQFGHEYGDELIKLTATIIKEIFNEDVYRIGGDEFVALCHNIERREFECKVVDLRKLIEKNAKISASIGTTWEENSIDINRIIKHADELMNANKQYFYRYTSYQGYNHHSMMAKELLKELEDNKYCIYLQPQIDINTGVVRSAEALIRKKDEALTHIYPDSFIPHFEKAGVVSHLDFFVLDEACKLLQTLKQQNKEHLIERISVNFSRVTLLEDDVVNKMVAICQKYQINPNCICIEVTESVSKLRSEELIQFANNLKKQGFYLSLDDYGAKYSNIFILSILDFDEVKIDKSIISELSTNEKARSIIRSILFMCKELKNTVVVAEGIEEETQLHYLKEYGCDYGQGFYFSKAIPIEEFVKKYVNERN